MVGEMGETGKLGVGLLVPSLVVPGRATASAEAGLDHAAAPAQANGAWATFHFPPERRGLGMPSQVKQLLGFPVLRSGWRGSHNEPEKAKP